MAAERKDRRGNAVGEASNAPAQKGADGTASPVDGPLLTRDDALTPEMRKYQGMLEANPSSRVFATLAELYRKRGMLDQAISLCLKGLSIHPAYLSGRVVLGRAYFDKGLVKEAAQELERVVGASPDHLLANKVLGDVSIMSGDLEKARYYFERVLTLAPGDLEVKKKLEPMRTGVPSDSSSPPDPGDEVIEGESLEIVGHDQDTPDVPEAEVVPDDREPAAEDNGADLTVDEISDLLVTARSQIHDIESAEITIINPMQAPAQPPPPLVPVTPESPDGLLPLYRAIERMQIAIIITDLDGKIHYANPATARMYEWGESEAVGRHVVDFFPPGIFQPIMMHEILEKKGLARDTVNIKKDGSVFPVRMTFDIVENESREPTYIIIAIDDLTKHKDIEESLWQYAVKDAETGLFNRRHFVTKIAEENKRAERMGYPLSLLVFSIKDFASYKKLGGKKTIDKTLAEIGKIARTSIRKEVDSAFRLGDDEFALILPTATEEKAAIVASRLTHKVARRLPNIELRIGTASRTGHASIEEMIAAAEKAMYR